jgi:hypothetical protein
MSDVKSNARYFETNITKHSKVAGCTRLKLLNEDEYVYRIERKDGLPSLHVHVSGAYEYGKGDYDARPTVLRAGDFILVDQFTRSEHSHRAVIATARRDGIGIGPLVKLYGALNFRDVSKYEKGE